MDSEVAKRVSNLTLNEYNFILVAAFMTLQGADGCDYESALRKTLRKAGMDVDQTVDIEVLDEMIGDL